MVGQITGKNELKKNGSGYSDPTAYKAIMNVTEQERLQSNSAITCRRL